jgi:serine/threonine-protein kinase
MCRFLRYVIAKAVAGASEGLKEYSIGVEVFDRKPSYDPRIDPIVRVEARRLRAKLADYYQRHASEGDLAIDLPKGSYVPRFGRSAAETHTESFRKGIAVLPFLNTSSGEGAEFVCDALTLEIIHRLTQVEELRVVAWTSAVHMRGAHRDLREAGRALNVDLVLTGSVRTSAARVRVLAQLVDARSGVYLWSQSYDRGLDDLLAIEETISQAIVGALRMKLGVAQRSPKRPEAYSAYLKGRYQMSRRTPEGLQAAAEFFRESVSIEPEYALAHAGLADAYILLADYGLAAPGEIVERARAAATEALRIEPATGEAEAALGLICAIYDWDWERSEQHYIRAMEWNPSYAPAFHWYSIDYCALRSRFESAREALDTALALDPFSSIAREGRAYMELLQRRFLRATELYDDLISFDPLFYKAYTGKGRALMHMGDYERSIEMLERGRKLAGGDVPSILGALGQAHGLAGNADRGRECLSILAGMRERRFVLSSSFALLHAGLGERDQAIAWLERGFSTHEPSIAALGVHPGYDSLREEPRFNALVQKIGA